MATTLLLTFRVAGALYGVPLEASEGVDAASPVVPLPDSPPHLRGLTNRRGYVTPVLDLVPLLAEVGAVAPSPAAVRAPAGEARWHVALRAGDLAAAVEVDAPPDVVDVGDAPVEVEVEVEVEAEAAPAPGAAATAAASPLRGVMRGNNGSAVWLLDVPRLLAAASA